MKATASAHITLAGQAVHLLAGRSLFWSAEKTLFLADAHFGKAATFRRFGMAAPDDTEADLARLDFLLKESEARRLVVLGDFFHARAGRSDSMLATMREWRIRNDALEIVVVRGNHDQSAGDPPGAWNIRSVAEGWPLGPFICCHQPCSNKAGYVFSGHVHPAFSLRERSGTGLRAACFVVGPTRTIFPAFGSFTGMATIKPEEGERIYAMNGETIIQVWGRSE
jgi:DNA ligase-associated metallophosphoesterase